MSNRYVRIYSVSESADALGFSMSAIPDEQPAEFFNRHNYTSRWLDWDSPEDRATIKEIGGVSGGYCLIEPPLREDIIRDLAKWCIDHIDPSHNMGFLFDNRGGRPVEPYDSNGRIASW